MTDRGVPIDGRALRQTRRLTLAACGLVVVLLLGSALAPAPHVRRRSGPAATRSTRSLQTPTPPPGPPAVSTGALDRARVVAHRFLAGYLAFLYGRAPGGSVGRVTPGFGLRLTRARAVLTPAEGRRQPRLVSLAVVEQAPGVVVVTALIADSGVAAYALRITVRWSREGWLVSGVDGR